VLSCCPQLLEQKVSGVLGNPTWVMLRELGRSVFQFWPDIRNVS